MLEIIKSIISNSSSGTPFVVYGSPKNCAVFVENLLLELKDPAITPCTVTEVLEKYIIALCDHKRLEWRTSTFHKPSWICITNCEGIANKPHFQAELLAELRIIESVTPILVTSSITISEENGYIPDFVEFLMSGTHINLALPSCFELYDFAIEKSQALRISVAEDAIEWLIEFRSFSIIEGMLKTIAVHNPLAKTISLEEVIKTFYQHRGFVDNLIKIDPLKFQKEENA